MPYKNLSSWKLILNSFFIFYFTYKIELNRKKKYMVEFPPPLLPLPVRNLMRTKKIGPAQYEDSDAGTVAPSYASRASNVSIQLRHSGQFNNTAQQPSYARNASNASSQYSSNNAPGRPAGGRGRGAFPPRPIGHVLGWKQKKNK